MEDADAAVEAGAAALGFVFWPKSPRFVDPHRARAIVASLPPFVVPVGVFVNQPAAYVKGVAALVGLGAVQLHGDEDVSYAAGIAVSGDQGRGDRCNELTPIGSTCGRGGRRCCWTCTIR